DRSARPEDDADPERLLRRPRREIVGDVSALDHTAGVLHAPGEHDLPNRERDDQRVEPQDPDEQAVRETDAGSQAEADEDGECEPVVRPRADADDESPAEEHHARRDRKSTRLNSSHEWSSYAVFCLKK